MLNNVFKVYQKLINSTLNYNFESVQSLVYMKHQNSYNYFSIEINYNFNYIFLKVLL